MLHGKKESLKSEKIAKEAFSNNSSGSSLPLIKLSKRIEEVVDWSLKNERWLT